MKNLAGKIIFTLLGLVLSVMVMGQNYRTRQSGDWNSNTTWQVRSGGSWDNCSFGDYPGASIGTETVNIRNAHLVTVNSVITNNITRLRIRRNNQNTFVQFTSAGSLNVTQETSLISETDNIIHAVLVDDGTFNTGTLDVSSSGNDNTDAGIRISSGEVTVEGDISLNSTSLRTYIQFTGNGTLKVGGAITGGNITSDDGGGNGAPASGTVIYNGTAAQNIGEYGYNNLTIDNSNGVSLTSDITVNNTLTMSNGNITTGANILTVAGNSHLNLVHTSGTIIGGFRRAATITGSDYLFPVGTSSNYNPLTINFTNLTNGSLTVSFQPSDPGTNGLPLNDDGLEIDDRFTAGFWLMSATNNLASNNYNLTLNANGFGGLTELSRIVSGSSSAILFLNGNHGSVSDPVITRTGMSGIPYGVGIGKGIAGGFITHPSDYTGCNPSFTVEPGGIAPFIYQWQVNTGSGFTNISNNAIYNGATSATLTIPGATEAMTGNSYRCVVTDANSNSITSNSAILTFSLPDVYFGYRYSMELTLDAASGGDDLTDFPVLINLTNTLLRTESNGGHVVNTNGYDIIFTDENGSRLYSQTENYNPTTGALTAWVRVPLLSASSTTAISILYGNNNITTDQSSDNTWTSGYKGVWHLNGTDYSDGTINSNNGAQNNTSTVNGVIAGARGFNGSNSYIQVPTSGFVPNDNNQTISIWARYSSLPSGNTNLITFQNEGAKSAIQLGFRGGRVTAWKWEGGILITGPTPPSTNNWHYYVYTYDGTHSQLYIDGINVGSSTAAPQTAMPNQGNIGRYNNGEYFNGSLDEPRFSISPRTEGWILTEYNNQNSPTTFVTMGTETDNNLLSAVGACSSTFSLNQGYPSGGVYSGPGVSGTNFNASAAGVGTHTVTYTYTDGNGCSNSAIKNIIVTPVPAAPVAPDVGSCYLNILDLTATGTNLTWYSNAALTTVAGTGTPFATGTTAVGTYTYYVTQTVNSCRSAATTVRLSIYNNITINTQPQPIAICDGDNAQFTVVASGFNLSYQWLQNGNPINNGANFSGATTSTLTVINPGLTPTGRRYSCRITSPCGSGSTVTSSQALLTVTPRPVATFSYTSSPYCINAENPFPTFSNDGIAGTFSSTPGLVFISTASGQVNLAASTPGSYIVTNTIAASGGCGIVTATSPISIIADLVWTGAVNTDWNNAGNWSCGFIPDITTDVQIPDVPNKPVINPGATGTVNDLTIDNNSSLTINSNTIQISGTITNNGTFTASSGTIEMNGSAPQFIGAGLFTDNTVNNLTINNSTGVTLLGPLNISGIVLLTSGDLISSANLSLLSTATQTGLIDGSGTGNVIGNVTMQRYLPSGFGYKYFSSPFQSATVNEFADDMTLGAFNFFRYDESRTSSGWVSYNNPVTNPLIPLHGYAVNFGSLSAAKTVDVTGAVNDGNVTITLFNNNNTYTKGFNLVGNPYPSPIDWDAVSGWTKTNIDNALYYFKASTTDQYGGTYSTYINDVSSDGIVNNIIPSMQAFFVHVKDDSWPVTGILSMDNNVRITNQTHSFTKSKGSNTVPLIRLSASFSDDITSADPIVIYFDQKASKGFDPSLDALKLFNTDLMVPNLYMISQGGEKLSINALAPFSDEFISVALGLKLNRAGNLVFQILNLEESLSDMKIFLSDIVAGTEQNLLPDRKITINLETGEYLNRFYLNMSNITTNIKTDSPLSDVLIIYCYKGILKVDINKLEGKDGTLMLYNLTGQVLFNKKVYREGHYEFNPGVKDGIYIVSFLVEGRVFLKRYLYIINDTNKRKNNVCKTVCFICNTTYLSFCFISGGNGTGASPRPITVTPTGQILSFGAFTHGMTGGAITVNPGGSRSGSGDIILLGLGYLFSAAAYNIVANPGTLISLLNGPDVLLDGDNGGSMTLRIGSSSPETPFVTTLAYPTPTPLYVGGTLTVGNSSSNPPGNYSGTFYITFMQE